MRRCFPASSIATVAIVLSATLSNFDPVGAAVVSDYSMSSSSLTKTLAIVISTASAVLSNILSVGAEQQWEMVDDDGATNFDDANYAGDDDGHGGVFPEDDDDDWDAEEWDDDEVGDWDTEPWGDDDMTFDDDQIDDDYDEINRK